jgi:hypothetical protein
MSDDRGPILDTVCARNLSGEHVGLGVTVPAEDEISQRSPAWSIRGVLGGVVHRRDDDYRDSVLLTVLVGDDFRQSVTVKVSPLAPVRIDPYERLRRAKEEAPPETD